MRDLFEDMLPQAVMNRGADLRKNILPGGSRGQDVFLWVPFFEGVKHQSNCKPRAGGHRPAPMPMEKKGSRRLAGSSRAWAWSAALAPSGSAFRRSRAAAATVGMVTAVNTRRS